MICSLNIADQEWRLIIWFLIDLDDSEKFPVIGPILFYFTVFQAVFLTLLLFLSIPYVIVVAKCRKFHMNLTRIIVFTKIHMIFMIGITLLGLLYVFRFIKKTRDCLADFPLLILSYSRFINTFINFWFFPAILFERIFSIRYMWDYEKKRRIYIANTINASTMIIAIFSATFLTVVTIKIQSAAVFFALPLFVSTMLSFLLTLLKLKSMNERILNELKTHATNYALSARYQAAENILAFKFIHSILYYVYLAGLGGALVMISLVYCAEGSLEAQVFGAIAECWLTFAPLGLIMTGLISVTEWRRDLRLYLLKLLGTRATQMAPIQAIPQQVNRNFETQTYFSYYRQSW